jgi:Putative Ig domain
MLCQTFSSFSSQRRSSVHQIFCAIICSSICLLGLTGCLQQTLSITIQPAPSVLAITTTSLPDGTVGQAYSRFVQATGGTSPFTWSIVPGTGTLPANLTLNSASGGISGTPTAAGTSSFTVRVADARGQSAMQALSITINLPAPPNITTTTLPAGTIGQAYSQPLQVAGGTAPLTWSIVVGNLPAGLSLNQTTGVISGTPTAAGTSSFTIRVQDAGGLSDTQALSITINLTAPPQITTTTLPGGTVGQSYSQTLHATGGIGALTWSLAAGALPAGLTLNPAGTISGTPTNPGTSNFTVRVVDTFNQSDTQSLSLTVSVVLAITTTSLPNAKEGQAYSTILQSSGGIPPLSWSVTPPLPNGLNLNPATGQITGTPAAATQNIYFQMFTVQDSSTPTPQTANKQLSLTIDPP